MDALIKEFEEELEKRKVLERKHAEIDKELELAYARKREEAEEKKRLMKLLMNLRKLYQIVEEWLGETLQ
jgi:hypothetical protein